MTVSIPSESDLEMPDAEPADVAASESKAAATEPPNRREKVKATTLCVFGFLTLYLLSAGPVAGIHNVMKIRIFEKAVEVIYAPVVLLVKSDIEPFSSIMAWYVDLFR
ncbi:MAG: hypothetical protein ACKVHE_00110 [Planctomycetales bacterium]|jgi:hypothetical protein